MRRITRDTVPNTARAVALGSFDGLHLGHRAVISAACARPDIVSGGYLVSCVLSLTGVPKGDGSTLCAPEREAVVLDTLGVDEWLELPLESVRELSPEAFVKNILKEELHAVVVCCGDNYRFGKDGAGDTAQLTCLCEQMGISVVVVPPVEWDCELVSSTRIRHALQAGDVETAARLLGRPYTVDLPVTAGHRLGHTLGFPTINQVFPAGRRVPRFGVYASLVIVEGRQYFAVTNIGVHPTVGSLPSPQAETWIDGFDGDLYGQFLSVQLIRFLRPEQYFSSLEALKDQLVRDRQAACDCLSGKGQPSPGAVLFDFDDTLQNRRIAFRGWAEYVLEHHLPGLSPEEREKRIAFMERENNDGYMVYLVFFGNLFRKWPWQGLSSPEAMFEEYMRIFPEFVALFDDTVDTLHALRARGYKLGVVTNGVILTQERKLDVAGLRPLVDEVLVGGSEGVGKPDPEIFRRAAARLCLSPEQCVFVGDYLPNDIIGALGAGMRAVYINAYDKDVHPENPAVTEIKALRELTELLK